MYLNFIFSSITFLQSYIPLVIEGNRRGIQSKFFIRKNKKLYADPLYHQKFYEKLLSKYNVKIFQLKDITKCSGIVFMVDGDIYGPSDTHFKESILKSNLLNKNHIKISIPENFNYYTIYHKFYKLVDYMLFPNTIFTDYYNFKGNNHIYIGVPKYDINFNKIKIYQKYELHSQNKYILIFYPRFDRGNKRYRHFNQFYNNIIDVFRELGYKIIVKNREKLDNNNNNADYMIYDKTYYPNVSMELLEIVSFAVFFGSSVIEEVVMAKVPFLEIKLDEIHRFPFLRHPDYSVVIEKELDKNNIWQIVVNLMKIEKEKKDLAFDKIIEKYLFDKTVISKRILDIFIPLVSTKL